MPFANIVITGQEPVIGFNMFQQLSAPADGTYLVVAFDVPPWTWSFFNWSPPRRSISVTSSFPSNSGVYGPNPPVISGLYGKVSGPAIGQYATTYTMTRVLYPGRYYLVVRPQTVSSGSISIEVV
jgi:hypothetical protein